MKLKQLLKEKDITASQLARRLNQSVAVVWKWCNDKSFPDVTLIRPIAAILSVSSDRILDCFDNLGY